MTHLESYVPLRNIRENRTKTSQKTSYWSLKSAAEVPEEGISKGDTGTESTEIWSAIKNVKDYVLSSGYQVIDSITALCKTPRCMDEISGPAPQQLNNPTQSPVRRFRPVWPNSLLDPEERSSWIKNMLSDPDVSEETKLIIWHMVENEYTVQAGSEPPIFFGNQHRLLPPKALPRTSLYSPSGPRQIHLRRSLYEAPKSNWFPHLQAARGLSNTSTERTAVSPYRRDITPYWSQARRRSRGSARRGFDNFQGVRSSFSVTDMETQFRSLPIRDFGLSPTAKYSRSVNYSDPAISQAVEKYRRGDITDTKENFDNYTQVAKSQFVGSRARLQLNKIKKTKQRKRKTYKNRFETSKILSVKRSRCEDKKQEIGAGVIMDICSLSTGFEPNASSTASVLTNSSIMKDGYKHLNKSSKDDNMYNSENQMPSDSVASSSLVAAPTSGVVANLSNTMPKEESGSSWARKGERFGTLKLNLMNKENSRPSIAEDKVIETKPTEKRAVKVPEDKLKVADEVAPAKIMPCENVSYVCRKAQMRRIKIKEYYSQEIEKLYDLYCKDKDKDAKKKKALDIYESKYHKTRQDYTFYTKLCKKYEFEPGKEYDGNDPDIKLDDEEKQESSEATQSWEQKPTPLLFGIPLKTNIKSADTINPFKNNLFTAKKSEKDGGLNFEGNNDNLLNKKSSKRDGLFLKESDKSAGQLNPHRLFSGQKISGTPSVDLLEYPIQEEKEPAPFSFSSVEPNKGVSNRSTIAGKRAEARKNANASDIFEGSEKSSLWKQNFECTVSSSQGKETQTKDEKTSSSRYLKIFGDKAPSGNIFGVDSNNSLTIPKTANSGWFNLLSSSAKPADGGPFGTTVAKNDRKSSSAKSGGLFSGTNMFDVESNSSPKPFVNCGNSESTSAENIFTSNANSHAPGSLLSPPSQSSSKALFSSSEKGIFSTNNNGFNINKKNEKSEPKFSVGNVNGKSRSNMKKRQIARGRRKIK